MTTLTPSSQRALRARLERLTIAALLPVTLLVTGCGATTRHPQVASLPQAGHTHTTTTTTTTSANEGIPDPDGRPRQGLDQNSTRDLETLYDPYYHCVYTGHHIPSKFDHAAYQSALTRAVAACIRLDPLPPWPLDPSNPQSRTFIGLTVTCMRKKGYQASAVLDPGYVLNSPEWTVAYEPGIDNVSERVAAIQYGCQDQAQREMSGG